jgi:hypothetical protein
MVEADIQSVVDKYARALEGSSLIFDLYPKPRPQGRPQKRYRPLPAAVTLSVISTFEGFAEDLVASFLYGQGFGWAYIALHANLTNPSVNDLRKKLDHIGIEIQLQANWTTPLPKQTSRTGWDPWGSAVTWNDLLTQSDSWMQVRHCLAHGLVTGLEPEIWPGPLDKRSASNQEREPAPKASDVLARTNAEDKKALQLYPAIACARIYSVGAAVLAGAVADHLGEVVDTSALHKFDEV